MESDHMQGGYAVVFETNDQSALAIAEAILRDAGIPALQQLEAAGAPPWPGIRPYGLGLYLLLVSPKDAEDARALLADLARGGAEPQE